MSYLRTSESHDYLICYNRSYKKETPPKFSGLKYLEVHCFLMCQFRASGQFCSMKSSGEASKQEGSVSLDNAFQGCVALPFQTEGEKEWTFIAKALILSKGHRNYTHHICSNSNGRTQRQKLQVGLWNMPFLSRFDSYVQEEGRMD